jgi:hypothetical protein
MYNEKLAIAREVLVNGSATLLGMTFVKYHVEKVNLSDGSGVIKVSAENSEGGNAVTYLICRPGTVYNVNFIYDSSDRAASQDEVRTPLIASITVD